MWYDLSHLNLIKSSKPQKPPKPNLDPFAANWDDTAIETVSSTATNQTHEGPHRQAPAPPKAPTPPPKDY